MLVVVTAPLAEPDPALPQVWVRADRVTLAKRLWRGIADDGLELGFELTGPVKHGQTVHQTAQSRYVIRQELESLLEMSLDVAPSAAAGIGWAIGNLHLELAAEASRLLAPDSPAVRQLLDRLQVPYRPTTGVFRPGHFVRSRNSAHELGPSHRH
jgi:urease accessory protein